jgi:hypothetical protein
MLSFNVKLLNITYLFLETFFLLLIILFLGEEPPGNSEFDGGVNKV